MENSQTYICNNCKEIISTQSNSKIVFCPYCGSNDISIVVKNEIETNERTLFGTKVDASQINDKLLWTLFIIVILALFAFLFIIVK